MRTVTAALDEERTRGHGRPAVQRGRRRAWLHAQGRGRRPKSKTEDGLPPDRELDRAPGQRMARHFLTRLRSSCLYRLSFPGHETCHSDRAGAREIRVQRHRDVFSPPPKLAQIVVVPRQGVARLPGRDDEDRLSRGRQNHRRRDSPAPWTFWNGSRSGSPRCARAAACCRRRWSTGGCSRTSAGPGSRPGPDGRASPRAHRPSAAIRACRRSVSSIQTSASSSASARNVGAGLACATTGRRRTRPPAPSDVAEYALDEKRLGMGELVRQRAQFVADQRGPAARAAMRRRSAARAGARSSRRSTRPAGPAPACAAARPCPPARALAGVPQVRADQRQQRARGELTRCRAAPR